MRNIASVNSAALKSMMVVAVLASTFALTVLIGFAVGSMAAYSDTACILQDGQEAPPGHVSNYPPLWGK